MGNGTPRPDRACGHISPQMAAQRFVAMTPKLIRLSGYRLISHKCAGAAQNGHSTASVLIAASLGKFLEH